MNDKVFLADEGIDAVTAYFEQFGSTDVGYLRAHWDRFKSTRDFALAPLRDSRDKLHVLDIGAHWLHQAFLYANAGHKVTCIDVPDTFQLSVVKELADRLNATLLAEPRMEKANAVKQLDDSSVDLVLFCEIIEHITFNPIIFWREIYRVLKPGGRIIVTTPNSFYGPRASAAQARMMSGEGLGITIDEIFNEGTYGHHWKEFSLSELRRYFPHISDDFAVTRSQYVVRPGEHFELPFLDPAVLEEVNPSAFNIYLEVTLTEKNTGILVSPPWDPM